MLIVSALAPTRCAGSHSKPLISGNAPAAVRAPQTQEQCRRRARLEAHPRTFLVLDRLAPAAEPLHRRRTDVPVTVRAAETTAREIPHLPQLEREPVRELEPAVRRPPPTRVLARSRSPTDCVEGSHSHYRRFVFRQSRPRRL